MAGQEILTIILAVVGVLALGFALFHAIGASLNSQDPQALSGRGIWWLVAPEIFLNNRGDHHLKRFVIWILVLVPCGLGLAILVT
ncbi:MAG: hypothetical protein ACK4FJ_18130 [Ferrovibrio sp.]|uniref:hypothetical protein n=1 Tax=Ferrovibrio sp. TaxID=1917215 RepID=UPI00391B3255